MSDKKNNYLGTKKEKINISKEKQSEIKKDRDSIRNNVKDSNYNGNDNDMEKTLQSIQETNSLILIQLQKLDALVTNQKKLKYQIHATTNAVTALIEGVALMVTTSQLVQIIIIILLTLSILNFALAMGRLGSGYFWKE